MKKIILSLVIGLTSQLYGNQTLPENLDSIKPKMVAKIKKAKAVWLPKFLSKTSNHKWGYYQSCKKILRYSESSSVLALVEHTEDENELSWITQKIIDQSMSHMRKLKEIMLSLKTNDRSSHAWTFISEKSQTDLALMFINILSNNLPNICELDAPSEKDDDFQMLIQLMIEQITYEATSKASIKLVAGTNLDTESELSSDWE